MALRSGPGRGVYAAMALAGVGVSGVCILRRSSSLPPPNPKPEPPEPEPEPEPEAGRARIRPLEVDLREDSEAQIRRKCRAALEGTLTPMLALRNHGCESLCAEMAARARAHHQTAAIAATQQACELDGPLAPLADEARTELLALTYRLLGMMAMEGGAGQLGELEGRLCLRAYPKQETEVVRLGAHCDATLLTLLWSDAPGLEVLDDRTVQGWTPRDVMACKCSRSLCVFLRSLKDAAAQTGSRP